MPTLYINRFGQGYRETVSEYAPRLKYSPSPARARAVPDMRGATKDCREYQFSDPSARYWVSSRPCKDWSTK